MDFHCDNCGFHMRFGRAMSPQGERCPACRLGSMRPGTLPAGFRLVQNAIKAFAPGGVPGPARPEEVRGEQAQLDFFANNDLNHYQTFIQEQTVFLGRFNKLLIPEPERFAWLSPYTGNKHNRRYFTQAALAQVAIAQFRANGGVFPRLIEPFVGSGQVFLNACCHGPAFNQGVPLFHEVIGGDLNPYVIAAYKLFQEQGATFADNYAAFAAQRDRDPVTSFSQRISYLRDKGRAAATESQPVAEVDTAEHAVMSYVYVVNRCLRGSKISPDGGVTATLNPKVNLPEVRRRELSALTHAARTVSTLGGTQFIYQDFAATCALAGPTDIVFMDCPFPKFSREIPKGASTSVSRSATASTYGVGDDGATLQARIVSVTRQLLQQGTTVILCNFANPALIRAYSSLLWRGTGIPDEFRRWFTFTYCSPATNSEAYQLTILPGRGKEYLNDVPATLRQLWQACGGDDNFGPPARQEFFTRIRPATAFLSPSPQPYADAVVEILPEDDEDDVSGSEDEFAPQPPAEEKMDVDN